MKLRTLRSGLGDASEVVNQLFLSHTDTGITDVNKIVLRINSNLKHRVNFELWDQRTLISRGNSPRAEGSVSEIYLILSKA